MFEERRDILMFWVLFAILIFETCCEKYDCYNLSSGKDICFMFDDTKRTFDESKQFCQNNGGFLLEIHDEEMQNHVEKYRGGPMYSEAWLNLVLINDEKKEWVWAWGGVPGNRLTYSNWDKGNPSTYGVNKTILVSGYKWSNAYDPHTATTFCIQGNRETFFQNSGNLRIAIGVGLGVGLGVLVLVIVSSLLVAKFVFHKNIPLPFKSSRIKPSSSSPPHQTGSDVIKGVPVNDDYEQIDDNKIGTTQNSNSRITYAEVVMIEASDESQPTRKSYYNINNNNCNNNNISNNNNNKALDYVEVECSNQSNFNQEPERVATPDGTLYTKTFQKI